jgi:hypothetical protein
MREDVLARALTLGLIALVVPIALRAIAGKTATNGSVRYSGGARWFAAIFSLLFLAATVFAATSSARGAAVGASIFAAFVGLGVFLLLEFSRVKHSYDDKGIHYRSPWSAHRSVAWRDIEAICWRSLMKWLDLMPSGHQRRVHLSPLLGGLDGLATTILRNVSPSALATDPEALAALRLMANGHAGVMVNDARKPSVIAAELIANRSLVDQQ